VSWVATTVWAVLVAAQAGWLPGSLHAWGFGLWRYLPTPASVALAVTGLLLCHGKSPAVLARKCGAFHAAVERVTPALRAPLAIVLVTVVLWLVRERRLSGDSPLLLLAVGTGESFVFPDTGATWLLAQVCAIGTAIGTRAWPAAQLWSCIWGGITCVLVAGLSRRLVASGPGLALAVVLCGGLIRVFAGHVETYPVLLAAIAAYAWAALACLGGNGSYLLCAITLGMAIWVHAAALCLVPSLAWLLWTTCSEPRPAVRLRRVALGLGLAGGPMLLFVGALVVADERTALAGALARAWEILGQSRDTNAVRWWVRMPGGAPSIGTDVVLFSHAQFKYLVNAAHLLSPATLPVLASVLAAQPRRFVETQTGRFLTIAALPLVVYAFALRPFWGPYDWDLFAPAALVLAVLAVHVLAAGLSGEQFQTVAIILVGFTALFVTLPLLATGIWEPRPAGPFAVPLQEYSLRRPMTPPPAWLAPWL
jgi:hypothetical protein